MQKIQMLKKVASGNRTLEIATPGDERLGPLKELPGVWRNTPGLEGRGWNMIALPFISKNSGIDYRILVNQYNEELKFTRLQGKVPNRGVIRTQDENLDQLLIALDYEQSITQIASADFPKSADNGADQDRAGKPDDVIHHEPGLWLNMLNHTTEGIDIARLATIPHGDSVLALGKAEEFDGAPTISFVDSLPIGATRNICGGYLAPYRHFSAVDISDCNPAPEPDPEKGKFLGLFDVIDPAALLRAATPANVVKTTKLEVTTKLKDAGIVNIPFIVNHANATEMTSTFWIMETSQQEDGKPVFILQYMQVVMLEFFDRFDGQPGLIKWPHISFNTMKRHSI